MGGFTLEMWKDRIDNRSDLTGMLTHLTKPSEEDLIELDITNEKEVNLKAVDNLIKILTDKKINGSICKGFIN